MGGGVTYIADANGTNAKVLVNYSEGGSWSPDGSRFAYVATGYPNSGIATVRADGSAPVQVTQGYDNTDPPAWSRAGRWIYFSKGSAIWYASSDGSGWSGSLNENPDTQKYTDTHPSVSAKDNTIIFQRTEVTSTGVTYSVDRYEPATPATPTTLISSAAAPDFSPDGTKIAYEKRDSPVSQPQIWIAKADGTNPTPLTADPAGATSPKWSPDGANILYSQDTASAALKVIGTNVSTPGIGKDVASTGRMPSWQPIQKNSVWRVWGQNAVGTAIAASQWNYRDNGNTADTHRSQANAVVLSRADAFYDALAGSALAINKQAPLLITYPSGLDSGVQAEIKRVLGTSGTVYLLGGTAALPAAISDKLTSLGYTVKRIWGATAIETAIAIDKEITSGLGLSVPHTAIVATAGEFYDALAAGAAAGANPGTAIVLTWGDSMPAASASYLNALNPDYTAANGTAIVAGGGPGDRALKSAYNNGSLPAWGDNGFHYWPLVGQNAKDTALLLAQFFFAAPPMAAVATSAGWYDALTGGAMIGANYGPLLLTDPSGLYGPVADYLSANSGSMWDGVILGGTAALPNGLETPIGNAISLPGQWTYTSFQPGTVIQSTRSMTAQSGPTTSKASAADQQAAATPPGISRTAATKVTR